MNKNLVNYLLPVFPYHLLIKYEVKFVFKRTSVVKQGLTNFIHEQNKNQIKVQIACLSHVLCTTTSNRTQLL